MPQHEDNIPSNEDEQLGCYITNNFEEDEDSESPEDVRPNSSGTSSDSSFESEEYSGEENDAESNIQCPSPLPSSPLSRDPSPFHIPKNDFQGEKDFPGLVLRQTSALTSKEDLSNKSKSQFYAPVKLNDDYTDEGEETYESILNDDTKNLKAEKRTDLVTPSGGLITSAKILTAHADYSGWLWRQDGFFIKSFVRFWALIYRCNLYLYNEPKDEKVLDYIKLSDVKLRRHRNNEGFLLDLMDSNTTGKSKVIQYIFETRNQELASTWIDNLRMAIAKGIEERQMASSILTKPVVVTTSDQETRRPSVSRIMSERPVSSETKTTVKARRARSDVSGSRKTVVPSSLEPEPVISPPIARTRKESKTSSVNVSSRNDEMCDELSAILMKRKKTLD